MLQWDEGDYLKERNLGRILMGGGGGVTSSRNLREYLYYLLGGEILPTEKEKK